MAIDSDGNIIDHFDGKKAIKDKIIKTVGNPNERFKEDKLRMMRACRFSSKLCFDMDKDTKDAIIANKDGIKDISIERIKDELVKMASLSGDKFADAITTLDSVGILDIILPEITKLKEFKETPKHHPEAYIDGEGSTYDHTLAALRKNKLQDSIINLSVLFHDIGKQLTYKKIGDMHTYYGHAKEGVDIINTIAKRLKLTNKEKDAIMFSMVNHMKLFKGNSMKPNKILKLVGDENWGVLKQVSYCDDSCRIGLFDKKVFNDTINNMETISKKWSAKLNDKKIKIIDGNRVMKITGIKPSKDVGLIIKKVTDVIINKGIKDQKEIDKYIIKIYNKLK
jgi:tRNA nucleotidyltransferase/poly(A) polymerase